MQGKAIHSVGIVGSGTMGAGIAQVCAMAGYEVILYDLKQEVLDKAIQTIENNLNKGIERGKISEDHRGYVRQISATI